MIENNTGFCETCSDGYYTTPSRYDSEWDCHLRACEVAGTGGGSGPAGPLGPSGSPAGNASQAAVICGQGRCPPKTSVTVNSDFTSTTNVSQMTVAADGTSTVSNLQCSSNQSSCNSQNADQSNKSTCDGDNCSSENTIRTTDPETGATTTQVNSCESSMTCDSDSSDRSETVTCDNSGCDSALMISQTDENGNRISVEYICEGSSTCDENSASQRIISEKDSDGTLLSAHKEASEVVVDINGVSSTVTYECPVEVSDCGALSAEKTTTETQTTNADGMPITQVTIHEKNTDGQDVTTTLECPPIIEICDLDSATEVSQTTNGVDANGQPIVIQTVVEIINNNTVVYHEYHCPIGSDPCDENSAVEVFTTSVQTLGDGRREQSTTHEVLDVNGQSLESTSFICEIPANSSLPQGALFQECNASNSNINIQSSITTDEGVAVRQTIKTVTEPDTDQIVTYTYLCDLVHAVCNEDNSYKVTVSGLDDEGNPYQFSCANNIHLCDSATSESYSVFEDRVNGAETLRIIFHCGSSNADCNAQTAHRIVFERYVSGILISQATTQVVNGKKQYSESIESTDADSTKHLTSFNCLFELDYDFINSTPSCNGSNAHEVITTIQKTSPNQVISTFTNWCKGPLHPEAPEGLNNVPSCTLNSLSLEKHISDQRIPDPRKTERFTCFIDDLNPDCTKLTATRGRITSLLPDSQIAITQTTLFTKDIQQDLYLEETYLCTGDIPLCQGETVTSATRKTCIISSGLDSSNNYIDCRLEEIDINIANVIDNLNANALCKSTSDGRITTGQCLAPDPTGLSIEQLASSETHNCVLFSDGNVSCWGLNNKGQLGTGLNGNLMPISFLNAIGGSQDPTIGPLNNPRSSTTTPVSLAVTGKLLGDFNALGAYGNSSQSAYANTWVAYSLNAATNPINLRGFGENRDQLYGVSLNKSLVLPGGRNLTQVSSALGFYCLLNTFGEVNCIGANSQGQLGDGTRSDNFSEFKNVKYDHDEDIDTAPANLIAVKVVTGGYDISKSSPSMAGACALAASGEVFCWGSNNYAQLGYSEISLSALPLKLLFSNGSSVTGVSDISFNGDHGCLIISDGSARCWGNNLSHAVGPNTADSLGSSLVAINQENGSPLNLKTRALASYDPNVHTIITVGEFHQSYSCAIDLNNDVWCWGSVPVLDAQDSLYGFNYKYPVKISQLSGSISLSGSKYQICGIAQHKKGINCILTQNIFGGQP